ncbi:DUF3857 domain-containing protein [Aliifodinibius sp. S!AR15-10]|uniref:DUF3857 domain-containing protein n=1 Tax=Aliifodinibius sp. S!AR15-10 TaxID=2950437 RepID=UPI00285827F4|nr:DUF3857 domain-containing protein [Aliifodinibius sp. S!AR15-10]MDR8389745.1 DUF3857 domain-containing protein [Aliifodinibius sp. S!AR15-10]
MDLIETGSFYRISIDRKKESFFLQRWPLQTTLLFALLLLTVNGIAQTVNVKKEPPDATFGEIPDSLFQIDSYRQDPSAPYFYAYKDVEISFEEDEKSIVAILDYHVRIKVFDSQAKQASIIAIPYYFQDEIESIEQIRGYTYQSDGSQVELQGEAIRTINLNARYNVKEFTMPEVRDGSVIEYSYRKKRRYIEELPDYYLTHQAPTAIAKATIRYPKYLRYDVIPVDFDGEVQHVEQRIDTSSVPKVFAYPRPEPLILHHWIARDVPAVEQESFISSIDDYRGKLKFQLLEFGVPRQHLENSWEIVVAQIRRNQNPWEVIEKNTRARELGEQIAAEFETQEQAQDSIFRYLNSQANFSDMQGAFSEVPDDSVLSGTVVNQPAINQTLIAMLQGAGIEAWPLLISTRQYGKINRSFPSYYQFNGLLTYSEINGQRYFMDASFAHSYPNLLPVESYNETGLLLQKERYEWIELKPANSVFSISIDMDAELSREGDLSGTISTKQFGYPARLIREKATNGSTVNEIMRDAMFDGYTDVSLENVEIEKLHHHSDTLEMRARFAIEGYATSYQDGFDYRPLVVGSLMSNPFGDEERDLPVTLDAPEKLNLSYELRLPTGYSLGEGTQNRGIQLSGAELTETYRSQGQTVEYGYRIDISRKQFEPELYPQLLDLYERWVELSNMSWRIKRQ